MKVYSYILNVATICPGKSGLQTNFEPLLFLLISQVFKAYWAQVTLKQINRWIFYLQQTNIFLLNISNEIWYYTISLVHSMSVFVNESKPWMSYISRVCLWVKKKSRLQNFLLLRRNTHVSQFCPSTQAPPLLPLVALKWVRQIVAILSYWFAYSIAQAFCIRQDGQYDADCFDNTFLGLACITIFIMLSNRTTK